MMDVQERAAELMQTIVPLFEAAQLEAPFAVTLDDGSVLIEWIAVNMRIGFGVELDPAESGWHLVTKPELGNVGASGYLAGLDLGWLATWLISFVIANTERG